MAILAAPQVAQALPSNPVVVDFTTGTTPCTSNCNLDGSDGNARTFTFLDSQGLTTRVRVTAWETTQSTTGSPSNAVSTLNNSNWRTAFLGQFSNGLGVTDRTEGDGSSNNSHTVDNAGTRMNFVVFHFDTNVTVSGADLNAYSMNVSGYGTGSDTDSSVFIGNVSTVPWGTSINLADTVQRTGIQQNYMEVAGTSASGQRGFNTSANYTGNVFVLAASFGDYLRGTNSATNRPDAFKIESLTVKTAVQAPEPAALGLLGLGIAGIGLRMRRRRK